MRLIDGDELLKKIPTEEVVARITVAYMPTIDPVKHGQWKDGKCTVCGEHAPFWCMASTYYESKYCPGCGSQNVGEEDEQID